MLEIGGYKVRKPLIVAYRLLFYQKSVLVSMPFHIFVFFASLNINILNRLSITAMLAINSIERIISGK